MSDTKTDPVDTHTATEQALERWDTKAISTPMGQILSNFQEGIVFSKTIAETTLVPKDFQGNWPNVFLAIQTGAELGLPPMQSLQSIAVISGRPALWGDAMLGLVRASQLLVSIKETNPTGLEAVCEVHRKGESETVTRTFSIEDARHAGLIDKHGNARGREGTGPWKDYPKRMCMWRARSWALRDTFGDVLKGIANAHELLDTHDANTIDVEAVTPKRRSETQPTSEPGAPEPYADTPEPAAAPEPYADTPEPAAAPEPQAAEDTPEPPAKPATRRGRGRPKKPQSSAPAAQTGQAPAAPSDEPAPHTMDEMRGMMPSGPEESAQAPAAPQDAPPDATTLISPAQRSTFRTTVVGLGLTMPVVQEVLRGQFGIGSTKDIPVDQLDEIESAMQDAAAKATP